MLSQIINEQGI